MGFSALAAAIKNTLLQGFPVSLSGIGLLDLDQEQARLVRSEGILYPPRKKVKFLKDPEVQTSKEIFNNLKVSEDLQNGYSKSDLEQEIEDLKLELASGKSVVLPDVGTFFKTSAQQLAFKPDTFNYDLSVYGMAPVTVRPIIKRTAKEAAEKALDARKTVPLIKAEKNKRKADRWFTPVAALLLIFALGIAGWLMLSDSFQGETYADSETAASEAGEIDYAQVPEELLRNESDLVPIEDEEGPLEEILPTMENSTNKDVSPPQLENLEPVVRYTHKIVIGHFGDPNNADQVVKRLENLNFKGETVITSKGLIRVLAKIDASKDDPEATLALLRSEFDQSAWLVKE
jgi:nucleoid DNA-binding protein